MDSPMSSAVSIASVPSSVSGLESAGDASPTLDKGQALVSHLTGEQGSNTLPIGIVPEYNGKPVFAAGDGDFRLWVGETCFETHKYLLKRFKVLEEMLLEQPSCAERRLTNARPDAEDFTRMFKVLYASILDGPIEFDATTLVSALRVATAYHHPRLRTYAIEKLEQTKLDAIERIRIAREFGLQSWEEPAYLELCDRDEPITIDEASVLGMNAFVRVAGIREREQRRRGREVDTRANDQETERPGTPVDETSSDSEGNRDGSHASLLEGATADRPETQIQSDDRHEDASEKAELQEDEAIGMKPSFVNAPLGHDYAWDEWAGNSGKRLRVSDCTCRFLLSGGSASGNQQQCTITPCTAVALKNIQIQQLAHAKSIAALKASMDSHVLPSEAKHTPAPNTRANANISTGKEVRHMVQTLQGQ